jgi:hypothetical protein
MLAGCVLALVTVLHSQKLPAASTPNMSSAQSDYVEHCGGCHGIQGTSFPAKVPPLRDKVGWFLCTPEGRDYLLRLPNVALSSTDDEQLAAIMNFVVFRLGGESSAAMRGAFTPEEVAQERQRPLSSASLIAVRAKLVRDIERKCHVPKEALRF